MNRHVLAALLLFFTTFCGGERLLGQTHTQAVEPSSERAKSSAAAAPAKRRVIQTIPVGGHMNLMPPHSAVRVPAWRDVEQRLEEHRNLRRQWGENYEDLESYYEWLASPEATGTKTLAEHLPILAKWRDELPKSSAARIVAAKALIHYAWEARGSGYAYTITPEGGRLFAERIGEAHRLLDEAIELGISDGEAYARLLNLAYAEGVSREQADAWLAAGMKLDPTYFAMYTEMAVYLMPRWLGEPGDIETFAADVAKKLPGNDGLETFARIAFRIQRYECGWGETLIRGEYDYDTLVRAAEVFVERYPHSKRVAHFAALCSLVAQNHAAAKRIRPHVGPYNAADKIWAWENSLKHFLNWSAAPASPQAEENWAFAGLTGSPGLAYGNERRHVWVAQQFGSSAANLMDVRTGKIELAIPSPGGVVDGLAFEPSRQWVVVSAGNGPLTGWMLWDLSGVQRPVTHPTQEPCRALAIHPKLPIVYWAEGKTVRSWDVAADAAGPAFEIKDHVHWLKISPAGNFLAANNTICDTASGNVKHEIGEIKRGTIPKILVHRLVAIDDQGQAWVTGTNLPSKDGAISLVRFTPDGVTSKTILENIRWRSAWLSPNHQLLATVPVLENGAATSPIDIWSIAKKERVKQFAGHWNSIQQLAFSPDGSKLASMAMWADAIKIWPLEGLAD